MNENYGSPSVEGENIDYMYIVYLVIFVFILRS